MESVGDGAGVGAVGVHLAAGGGAFAGVPAVDGGGLLFEIAVGPDDRVRTDVVDAFAELVADLDVGGVGQERGQRWGVGDLPGVDQFVDEDLADRPVEAVAVERGVETLTAQVEVGAAVGTRERERPAGLDRHGGQADVVEPGDLTEHLYRDVAFVLVEGAGADPPRGGRGCDGPGGDRREQADRAEPERHREHMRADQQTDRRRGAGQAPETGAAGGPEEQPDGAAVDAGDPRRDRLDGLGQRRILSYQLRRHSLLLGVGEGYLLATSLGRVRRRWHHRAHIAVGCGVQVGDDRCVVAGFGALAGQAVDPGGLGARGRAGAGEDQVDPHPEVLVEHAGPVVPVAEHSVVGPAAAHDIGQAERFERGQRIAFGGGHVGVALERRPVVYVGVGGGDVDVAAQHRRRRVGDGRPELGEPVEFVDVVRGVRFAAVGHVQRIDADVAAHRRHRARLHPALVLGDIGETVLHIVEADAGQQCDAVPLALAVVGDLVAAFGQVGAEDVVEGVVGEFGLL